MTVPMAIEVLPSTESLFLVAAGVFVMLAIVMLYRVWAGPTIYDRLLAVNVLGTNTVVVLALLSVALDEVWFLDIALIYALLNLLMALVVTKYTVERGELR